MNTLDEKLKHWASVANEDRDTYGLPPGLVERLVQQLKVALGEGWLTSILLKDQRPIDLSGLKGHPIRRWLLGPNPAHHVIQALEVAAYLKEFSSDPCLGAKVEKLKHDQFWPILFELAMAYRMKNALNGTGILNLGCESASEVGDFVIEVGGKKIACECSRLGFPPEEEEDERTVDTLMAYIQDVVVRCEKCLVKIRVRGPLTGKVWNQILPIVSRAFKKFTKSGCTVKMTSAMAEISIEELNENSEEIPFQLVDGKVVNVTGADWTCAFSWKLVLGEGERSVERKYRREEPVNATEHARILLKYDKVVKEDDSTSMSYGRLAGRVKKKLSQTKLSKAFFGRIVFIEWPYDLRTVDPRKIESAIVEKMKQSNRNVAVAIARREANHRYRHHYSMYIVKNQTALKVAPEVATVLGLLEKNELEKDPILKQRYLIPWDQVPCGS